MIRVGDRVKVILQDPDNEESQPELVGREGTVEEQWSEGPFEFRVHLDGSDDTEDFAFNENELRTIV